MLYHTHYSERAIYTEQTVQDADLYDHVIFGPSELATPADNIDKLAGTESFDTCRAIRGPDPNLPGAQCKPTGFGVRRYR